MRTQLLINYVLIFEKMCQLEIFSVMILTFRNKILKFHIPHSKVCYNYNKTAIFFLNINIFTGKNLIMTHFPQLKT